MRWQGLVRGRARSLAAAAAPHGGGGGDAGDGGAVNGGCAGAVAETARAREESGCRAGRWRRRGGELRRAAVRRSFGERRRGAIGHGGGRCELYGRKKKERERLYEGLDPFDTR
jgi:hypothetical protein